MSSPTFNSQLLTTTNFEQTHVTDNAQTIDKSTAPPLSDINNKTNTTAKASLAETAQAFSNPTPNLEDTKVKTISKASNGSLSRLASKAKQTIKSIFQKDSAKPQEAENKMQTGKKTVSFTAFMLMDDKKKQNYEFNMTMEEYRNLSPEMKENYALYSLRRSLNSDNPAHVKAAIKEVERRLAENYQSGVSYFGKDINRSLFENLLKDLKQHQGALSSKGESTSQAPPLKESEAASTPEAPIEQKNRELTPQEQKNLKDKFNDLSKKMYDLNSQPTSKLVFSKADGQFTIQNRDRGISAAQRGKSSAAKETATEVITFLNTLLEKNCFVKGDISKLQALKAYLKESLGPTFEHNPELQQGFNEIFKKIDEKKGEFPSKLEFERNSLDDFFEKYADSSLENIHNALFEMGGTLQDDFIKGGPWLKLEDGKYITEGKHLEQLMNKMTDVFKNGNDNQKMNALKFCEKLLDRGMIPDGSKAEVFKAMEGFDKIAAQKFQEQENVKNQDNLKTQSAQPMDYQSIDNSSVDIIEKFKGIANGTLKGEAKETFISQFAKDLSTINADLFKQIKPSEFHGIAWEKKPENASHLVALIKQSNLINNFIQNEVLKPGLKIEERQRIIETFLEIADHMTNHQNPHDYHGGNAIYAALNSNNISRISNLMTDKSQRLLSSLSTVYDGTQAIKELRDRIDKDVAADGGSQSVIPFIGMYTKDFILSEEGNPNLDEETDQPNLDKVMTFAKIHKQIESAQNTFGEGDRTLFMGGLPQALADAPANESVFEKYSNDIKKPSK